MSRRRDFNGYNGTPEECRLCGGVATERKEPADPTKTIPDQAPGWCEHCWTLEGERAVRNGEREPKPVRW